jgi:glucokinase
MLALNIGTGLGAAWVAQCDGVWRTFPSEGGHIAFGRVAPDEDDILPPDLTAEDVLSGYGVCALYDRVAARFGTRSQTLSDASQIFARAGGSAPEPAAARTVALLDRFIGRIAGDLVLTTGAWGGVYLCGSVAVAWSTLGDTAAFRTAFEAKGAMAARMADVPALVIRKPDVALSGLASMPL